MNRSYNAGKQPEIIMFTGKGGVGKTTCAAATALHYAASGAQTLAISTDATPSLAHIFEVSGNGGPIKVRETLSINELGVEEVRTMWDKRFGREVYGVFSSFVDIDYREFLDFTASILPGLSEEFMVDYIRDLSLKAEYSSIIWDTAPLGQTLALLQTPAMLLEHLKMAPRIYSRLRLSLIRKEPTLDIISRWRSLSADELDFLRTQVRFTMVTIPEALAVEQLEGVFSELSRYGLKVQQLIVNNVVKSNGSDFLTAKARQQRSYLDIIHHKYSHLHVIELPMFPYEIKGCDRLKEVERLLFP